MARGTVNTTKPTTDQCSAGMGQGQGHDLIYYSTYDSGPIGDLEAGRSMQAAPPIKGRLRLRPPILASSLACFS